VEPDQFECQAEAALVQFAENAMRESWSDHDPRWTPGVKSALGRIAKESHFDWYATRSEFADDGEWLLDGVAVRREDDGGFCLPFVIESEWESRLAREDGFHKGVTRDFLKLVTTRTDHRVLVFYAVSETKARERTDVLVEFATRFGGSKSGDRYLFACWCRSTRRFWFNVLVVSSTSDCRGSASACLA
jgi:hypothetical protein